MHEVINPRTGRPAPSSACLCSRRGARVFATTNTGSDRLMIAMKRFAPHALTWTRAQAKATRFESCFDGLVQVKQTKQNKKRYIYHRYWKLETWVSRRPKLCPSWRTSQFCVRQVPAATVSGAHRCFLLTHFGLAASSPPLNQAPVVGYSQVPLNLSRFVCVQVAAAMVAM